MQRGKRNGRLEFRLMRAFFRDMFMENVTLYGGCSRLRNNAMKPDIPLSPEQRWEWIKYQLRSRGQSFTRLAAELGVSHNAVGNTKYVPYPRMERAIAAALDMAPQQIWPERWNADGTPCRQRPNRAEKRECTNVQKHICAKDSGSNAIAHRQLAREV